MKLRLPALDAARLSRSFVLRQAKRRVVEAVNTLGEDRVRWLLEHNRSLRELLPQEQELGLRKKAQGYTWLTRVITEEDLMEMLPLWVKDMVAEYKETGQEWLREQVEFLRSFVAPGEGG